MIVAGLLFIFWFSGFVLLWAACHLGAGAEPDLHRLVFWPYFIWKEWKE